MANTLRRRLALSIAAALLLHGAAISVLQSHMAEMRSPLAKTVDPLFTRQISQTATDTTAQKTATGAAAAQAALALSRERKSASNITVKKPETHTQYAQAAPENIANNNLKEPLKPDASNPGLDTTTTLVTALTATPTTASAALPTAQAEPALSNTNLPGTSVSTGGTSPTNIITSQGTWPNDTRLTYTLGGYFRGNLHGSAQVQWTREPQIGRASCRERV